MVRKLAKQTIQLGTVALAGGILASTIPTNAVGTAGLSGLSNLSGALPVAGTLLGAGATIRTLGMLEDAAKPRKGRR